MVFDEGFFDVLCDVELLGVEICDVLVGGVFVEWVFVFNYDFRCCFFYVYGGVFYVGSLWSYCLLIVVLVCRIGVVVLLIDY